MQPESSRIASCMYNLARPFLFCLDPETAHSAAMLALRNGLLPEQSIPHHPRLSQTLWGLPFVHPVGLAAGFDKNAEAIDAIAAQGMAFVECGTVTPKPQRGNPRPRIFRVTQEQAVINRLGFNNKGLACFTGNASARKTRAVLGGNIGKNKDSEDAVSDYVACLEAVYPHVDYITVNISSPNTPGLRDLQAEESLNGLIAALHAKRKTLVDATGIRKAILVKIAPDLEGDALAMIAQTALHHSLDGLIIGNTTVTRPLAVTKPEWQTGGLSGKPLMPLATKTLAGIARITRGTVPLIGAGGIASAEDAYEKILHGASLVQLYTALIYQGFALVPRIVNGLDALLARDGFSHIGEAVGQKL